MTKSDETEKVLLLVCFFPHCLSHRWSSAHASFMRVFLTSILLISSVCSLTAAPPALSGPAREAYVTLRDAATFSSGRVGAAGLLPQEVYAFRTLKDDPMADAAFKSLLKEATPAGQLYALCGLWFTDPGAFKTEAERLKRANGEVDTLAGCVGMKSHMADIIESTVPGAVRLTSNKQSVKDWLDTHKGVAMHYDIVSGALPSMVWNEGGFPRPRGAN
jgi:hypothetical protein